MRPPRCQTCPRRIKTSRAGFLRHCYDCRLAQGKTLLRAAKVPVKMPPRPGYDPVEVDAAFDAAMAAIRARRRAA